MSELEQAYKSLFDDGAGPGNSPSWISGGVYGGVPMGGGRKNKSRLRKSKKNKLNKIKKHKKSMRKSKKYSTKSFKK